MSNLAEPPATMATGSHAQKGPAASPAAGRRPRLRGLNWLVWRQHRAGLWTVLALTAICVAWLVYQRSVLMDQLSAQGWPHSSPDTWLKGEHPQRFQLVGFGLGFVPIVLGVFLGAPLFAGDLENGTATLVASQSVSPRRWLATKLAITGLVVVVCTGPLSIAFGRWWGPVKYTSTALDWSDGAAFDNTGPVPVALALFTVVGGAAIGMLLRRTLMSMVVTFAFAVAVQVVWHFQRLSLGHVVTVTTRQGIGSDAFPRLPQSALEIDHWYISGSGRTYGWGTCAHEASEQICARKYDLVGWKVEYLPISQMTGMQWFGACILVALTAAVSVFIFARGRKRIV